MQNTTLDATSIQTLWTFHACQQADDKIALCQNAPKSTTEFAELSVTQTHKYTLHWVQLCACLQFLLYATRWHQYKKWFLKCDQFLGSWPLIKTWCTNWGEIRHGTAHHKFTLENSIDPDKWGDVSTGATEFKILSSFHFLCPSSFQIQLK